MARLISYPTISTVASGDLFPVTDISGASKPLKNITAEDLQTFVNDGATLQRVISTGNTYQANLFETLWTWGTGAITATSTSFTSLLSGKRFKTTLIADGSYTDVLPNQLVFNNALGNQTSITPNTAVSSNIDLQWPSASGTLALTTDISVSPWDAVTGGINYAGGNVGIGPGLIFPIEAKLEVSGDAKINGLTVGRGSGSLSQNVALGIQALDSNTTGNRNTSIGDQVLKNNTTGNSNVGVGQSALNLNETSSFNTAIGALALIYIQNGGDNTAIGWGAGGNRVGGTNASSAGSVFIGKLTTSNGIGAVNEIVIGTDAISAGSNTVVLGNDLITSTRLKGDVIIANGNLGLGSTSPTYKLDVLGQGGAARFASVSSTALVVQGGANAQDIARFKNSLGDVKFVIDTNGNAGIGTASPASKLEVDGGDIEVDDSASGLILRSPDGTRYRITVANGGTLAVTAV